MDAAIQNEGTVRVRRVDRARRLREAEDLYGIPEHRLRQHRSERVIDFFKLGRSLIVSENSLLEFLERNWVSARTQEEKGRFLSEV